MTNNFEIDPQAAQKIMVKREDFNHALENDIKPVRILIKLSLFLYNFISIDFCYVLITTGFWAK